MFTTERNRIFRLILEEINDSLAELARMNNSILQTGRSLTHLRDPQQNIFLESLVELNEKYIDIENLNEQT